MPSLQSFARLVALALCLSLPAGAFADEVQDINQLFRKGDLSTALARANQYLTKSPKDAQVRFLKGLILADQGKSAEAIQVFNAITDDYPELPEPYNNLAVLYAAEGKYDAAKNALEMAIRTHPSYATAHENLGDLYARMASQSYDKALQIDNSNKTAQTKLALIKEIMSNRPQAKTSAASIGNKPAAAQPQAAAPVAKPVPAPVEAKPSAAPAEPRPVPEPASKPAGKPQASIQDTVQAWAKAWSKQDVDGYIAHYSPDFKPANTSHAKWAEDRRDRIKNAKRINVSLRNIQVKQISPERADVTFRQIYQSDRMNTSSSKTLSLQLVNGKWLIVRESGR